MAVLSPHRNTLAATADDASDYGSIADDASNYGSEIDDATALELLSQAESQPLKDVVLESIEEPISRDGHREQSSNLRLPRAPHSLDSSPRTNGRIDAVVHKRQAREVSVEVEYAESNRRTFSPSNADVQKAATGTATPIAVSTEALNNDARSPLERFRTRPKKPLSVTDLVSPAWCEQQYEYSLTKYGRVRKTPAMKQGSSVHKELEEQVHVQVPVETVSAEDRFALRTWNTIQGLRTLRETGLTREVEVWGVIQGEVVIGIIDEITTVCPDEAMEAEILDDARSGEGSNSRSNGKKKQKGRKSADVPPDQRTLTHLLTTSHNASILENNPSFLGSLHEKPPTYYLVDVKTRQSRTLPAVGSQSRPTHMQLMIYHRLLSSLAANEVDAQEIFARYGLDSAATFSDKFIADIANLDIASYISFHDDEDISPKTSQKQDPLTELLQHNTLSTLWRLLMSEFALTFPTSTSTSTTTSLSPLLTAEYRTTGSKYATDVSEPAGSLIGRRSFPLDPATLDAYVEDEMRWWRGERKTKGVDVEEAYKCRICEFADECVWRKTRVEEGFRKANLRARGGARSEV